MRSGDRRIIPQPRRAGRRRSCRAGGARGVRIAEWGAARPVDRERWLLKLADLLEAHAQELAEIETLDNGKPVVISLRVDVPSAVNFLRYCAGWATKIEGTTVELSMPAFRKNEFFGYTKREPVGVVGQIIPWNFPLLMAVWKIGPALATGCTIVLKPAEETPLSALRLAELALDAGFPKGALNVVTGYGPTAGAALASHPGIDKVAFTGSTGVGKLIGKAALDNMTRISLELGGKSPVIVLDDVDPKIAATGAANAIFYNSGQVCVAGSRLYVQRDLRCGRGGRRPSPLRCGSADLESTTQLGPLVSETVESCRRIRKSGLEEGATLVGGGRRHGVRGWFHQPTILTGLRIGPRGAGGDFRAGPRGDATAISTRSGAANGTACSLAASIW